MKVFDDLAEDILDLVFGGASYTPETTWYAAVLTDEPDQDGTGFTEVSGGSYARVAKTNNGTNFPACTPGTREKTNGTVITFPTATANWGAGVGVGLFSASSGGDCKAYAPFPTPETINNGNTFALAVGQLKFRILA